MQLVTGHHYHLSPPYTSIANQSFVVCLYLLVGFVWFEGVGFFFCAEASYERITGVTMDILPSGNIFRELQDIHDTGYFSAQPSLEDHWQQVRMLLHLNPYHLVNSLSCLIDVSYYFLIKRERTNKSKPSV